MKPQPRSPLTQKTVPSSKHPKCGLLFEGKSVCFYSSEKPEFLIQKFKSNGSPDSKHNEKQRSLGAIKNDISSYLFEYLRGFHIPTHFVRKESDDEMMVRRLEMLPLLVKVHNNAYGDFTARFKMHEGTPLFFPVIEYYHQNANQEMQWLNEYHLYAFGIATPEEFRQINRLTSKVNAVLRSLCDRRKLMLIGFQLEFGRLQNQMCVGGELSPSTCFIYDTVDSDGLKKNRFLPNGEPDKEVYEELLDRLSVKV